MDGGEEASNLVGLKVSAVDGGPEHDREYERAEGGRKRRPVEDPPEQEEHDGLEDEDDERRDEQPRDVRRGRQRRRAKPFEDAVLAPQHELDREPGERGVRTAVAGQAREERPRRGLAVDRPAVDGAEQHEEQERKEEDEERSFLAPPEDELLRAELVEEDPHSEDSASISAR